MFNSCIQTSSDCLPLFTPGSAIGNYPIPIWFGSKLQFDIVDCKKYKNSKSPILGRECFGILDILSSTASEYLRSPLNRTTVPTHTCVKPISTCFVLIGELCVLWNMRINDSPLQMFINIVEQASF